MGDEFDDILGDIDDVMASNQEESEKEPETKPQYGGGNRGGAKKKRFDPFKDSVEPIEVNRESLKRFDRTFTIAGEFPEDIATLLDRIAEKLYAKGFTFRYSGDTRSKSATSVYQITKERCEIYLPWKKYNQSVEATVAYPKDKAYQIAANYHGKINDMSGTVKGFIAREAHMVLGEKLDTPLSILICYSEDGAEVSKGMDFKKNSKTAFFIKMCEDLDIPVFNLRNGDAKDRLIDYIKTLD